MNLKRFTARTSREALAMVKQTFGDDAVVMSTRPCAEGVEVLAMAPESVQQLERVQAPKVSASAPMAPVDNGLDGPAPATIRPGKPSFAQRVAASLAAGPRGMTARAPEAPSRRVEPSMNDDMPLAARAPAARQPVSREALSREPLSREPVATDVDDDVQQMAMSTLSFQDYVRERMLQRRQAELSGEGAAPPAGPPRVSPLRQRREQMDVPRLPSGPSVELAGAPPLVADEPAPARPARAQAVPVLREEVRVEPPARSAPKAAAAPAAAARPAPARAAAPTLADLAARPESEEMIHELRSMRGLIEQRFGALAFMEKLQRQPRHATLTQRLLESGFSPALIRRLADSLPAEGDAMTWAAGVLERNVATGEAHEPLEDQTGVFALIGSTGVGKTTSTAKLAAAFAARHGASNLGLITLDAYRVGAHEQLRAYGRILGVPVHTAHDRASLDDLLELLSAKRMVLIDTAGMAQRDTRTRELLEMLSHPRVQRLLVMNAAAQGETFEDVIAAYEASRCAGVILSKIDEAVKLGPALDVLIRHRLRVLAVANGQRVPEDWHRLSANALVQRALRSQAAPAWRYDVGDVNLVFAAVPHPGARGAMAGLGGSAAAPLQ
jgi:flagellar biosynthesis protein FlhF